MNKILLTMASAAVIAIGVGAISSSASAFLDVECRGHSCNDNSTTNQGGTGGTGGTGITGGSFGGEGGKGGKGGKGGTGYGGDATQGQQQGIFGSGNSENTNRNTNRNNNTNLQGQGQGQDQGQGQGQLQGQSQSGVNAQGQGQSTDNANNSDQDTNVTVEGDVYKAADIPVATAYSAPLTSAEDTCMGSTSAGFQGMSFGVSFGSTWRDEDCVRRKDSRMFYNMKMTDVALARMCQKDANREAVEAAGSMCPGTEASATLETITEENVSEIKVIDDSFDRDDNRG